MSTNSKKDKEKSQPIHVFIRPRCLSKQEHETRSMTCIEITSTKDIAIKQQYGKRYTFDKVFDYHSKQIDVYKTVVKPLIPEVIAGYNCTVFAYGQTGTGKTYTMAGGSASTGVSWQDDEQAGIIPRAMAHLFDELCLIPQQYTVRVSYLELYNEELIDLLCDNVENKNIRLFEDHHQKGSVIINGISTETVCNKNEVYNILQKGHDKRRTASTLLNSQSSRSHTVFIIMVHTCETTCDGEELVKTGKLNLVDLAGSENISRSGAVDRRAREAGNINQSLLTLGRVIKALVEKSAHIPYRESKLTRILQDSLGGRTKTSIIATISPSSSCLEETMSTLEYAHRAKCITNRPEINQRVSQKAWKAQYEKEMERLRKDLHAAHTSSGIYLDPENYQQLLSDNENCKDELLEKSAFIRELEVQIKSMEEEKEIKEAESNAIQLSFKATQNELLRYKKTLEQNDQERKEQEYLASYYHTKAETLHSQARNLLDVTDATARNFHQKLRILRSTNKENNNSMKELSQKVTTKCEEIINNLISFMIKVRESSDNLDSVVQSLLNNQTKDFHRIQDSNKHIVAEVSIFVNHLSVNLETAMNQDYNQQQKFLQDIVKKLHEVQDMSKWLDIKINLQQMGEEMSMEVSEIKDHCHNQHLMIEELKATVIDIDNDLNRIKGVIAQFVAGNQGCTAAVTKMEKAVNKLSGVSDTMQDNINYATAKLTQSSDIIDKYKNQEIAANKVLQGLNNCKVTIECTSNNVKIQPNHQLAAHAQSIIDVANGMAISTGDMLSEYTSCNNEMRHQLSELRSTVENETLIAKLQECSDELLNFTNNCLKDASPSGSTPVRLPVEKDDLAEPSPKERILARYRNMKGQTLNKALEFDEDSMQELSVLSENGHVQNIISDISDNQREEYFGKKKSYKCDKENKKEF